MTTLPKRQKAINSRQSLFRARSYWPASLVFALLPSVTRWKCAAVALFFWVLGLSHPGIAQTADTPVASGFDFYGQINRGILYYDDGLVSDVYPFVDNSKSVSRLGLTYDSEMQDGWHFQGRAEIGLLWKETNRVNQWDPNNSNFVFDKRSLRKLEVSFAHEQYGTFFLGQGAMSSDGVTGQDLSLTTVVAGAAVKDVAGGLYFRRTDGTLTSFRILDRFRTLGSSRRLRARYDTPEFNNFKFSIAAGKDVLFQPDGRYYADAAVRYDITKGEYRFKAAAAIRYAGGNPNTLYRQREVNFVTSASLLHKPSRYNFTVAYGSSHEAGYYGYAKLGRRWYKFLPFGWTAASIDYYYTKDGPNRDRIGRSVGLAVVQQVKAQNFDVYATIRRYEYDDPQADYLDSLAILTGIRWRF
jgi:Gram-negative porin